MNKAQKENLKEIIDGIETESVRLIDCAYFDAEDWSDAETMKESACCPVGYMVSAGGRKNREIDPKLFFKKNEEAVGSMPEWLLKPLVKLYGLSIAQLAELQAINDEKMEPHERKEAVLAYLKGKISA